MHHTNKSLYYSRQEPKDGYRGNHGSNSCNGNSCFPNHFKQQSSSNSENLNGGRKQIRWISQEKLYFA